MATNGLFGAVRGVQSDTSSQADRYARMGLNEMIKATSYEGGYDTAGGIGTGVGALFGVDVRPDSIKQAEALERVKRRMMGVDVNDPKAFYPAYIAALQAEGFIDEAEKAADAYRKWQLSERTQIRLEEKDRVAEELGRLKIEARDKTSPLMQAVDKIGVIEQQLADLPEGDPKRGPLEKQRDLIIGSLGKRNIKVVDDGANMNILTNEGEIIRTIPKAVTPNTQAQIDSRERIAAAKADGQSTEPIVGDDGVLKDPASAKAVSAGESKDFSEGLASTRELVRMLETFKDNYGGQLIAKGAAVVGMEDFVLKLTRTFNLKPSLSVWWQKYKQVITEVRHALFGATLTQGESQAFEQIAVGPSDEPAIIRAFLAQQIEMAVQKLQAMVDTFKVNGKKYVGFQNQLDTLIKEADAAKTIASAGGQRAPSPVERPTKQAAPEATSAAGAIKELKRIARENGKAAAQQYFNNLPRDVQEAVKKALGGN